MSDLESETGGGAARGFLQSEMATGTGDSFPCFRGDNVSASSSYFLSNQCHSINAIPSVLNYFSNINLKKKPMNAFMIFLRETRQRVADKNGFKDLMSINKLLGMQWHKLDQSEKMRYYDMARTKKELHGHLMHLN